MPSTCVPQPRRVCPWLKALWYVGCPPTASPPLLGMPASWEPTTDTAPACSTACQPRRRHRRLCPHSCQQYVNSPQPLSPRTTHAYHAQCCLPDGVQILPKDADTAIPPASSYTVALTGGRRGTAAPAARPRQRPNTSPCLQRATAPSCTHAAWRSSTTCPTKSACCTTSSPTPGL
jgi:hypothetical protein